ncbi:MAG: cupin domain-containing protein [Candidatus Kerfeldbacteria bacterium]|jgi:uncharacterized RmlC-like cupin family protein
MKIFTNKDSIHVDKEVGISVDYYLRDEYEVHYNKQISGAVQDWHHHEKISETIYIINGELLAEWKDNDKLNSVIVKTGDLIETEKSPHTFTNNSGKDVEFLVIKHLLSGKNKREILKNDKVLD